MNDLKIIGLIFFIIGALGFFSILGYGTYIEFGWLGVIISFAIIFAIIFIVLGCCLMWSD
jgi:hypothetical protein